MENIIIPIAILAALATVARYSCLVVSGREGRKEEETEVRYTHVDERANTKPVARNRRKAQGANIREGQRTASAAGVRSGRG